MRRRCSSNGIVRCGHGRRDPRAAPRRAPRGWVRLRPRTDMRISRSAVTGSFTHAYQARDRHRGGVGVTRARIRATPAVVGLTPTARQTYPTGSRASPENTRGDVPTGRRTHATVGRIWSICSPDALNRSRGFELSEEHLTGAALRPTGRTPVGIRRPDASRTRRNSAVNLI